MYAVYLTCLVAGAVSTAVFVALGAVGNWGHAAHGPHFHASHGHAASGHGAAGHAGHGTAGHAGQGHAAGAAHGQGPHATSHHVHGGRADVRDAGGIAARGAHLVAAPLLGFLLAWFSPLTIAAAVLWFGGIGLLADTVIGRAAIVVAVIAAVVGAMVVRAGIGAFVQASTPPLMLGAEGALATVNSTILPDRPGEVVYTLEGLTRSSPARSLEGQTLPRGASVAIVSREKGMAWVVPVDELDGAEAPEPALATTAEPVSQGDESP